MDLLWSASTTMRNPERTYSFLKTVEEIEGEEWNEATQMRYQALLIKNRYYKPTSNNLSAELVAILRDYNHELTYEESMEIFKKKNYVDPAMRGRTSFDPLEKLGLVSLERNRKGESCVKITDFGKMFLEGKIDLGEMVFTSLLKTQFPNPISEDRKDYNIKPFIGALHLIKRVNELCIEKGKDAHGVSREEFGIFVLSMKYFSEINNRAAKLLEYRENKKKCKSDEERDEFVKDFIADYLNNFVNPEINIWEYTDNIVRYLRLTKYIYIRGNGYYIDLEQRRMVEINTILEKDSGSARHFDSPEEYTQYMSDYYSYVLPFKTRGHLQVIAKGIEFEIYDLQKEQGLEVGIDEDMIGLFGENLEGQIDLLRDLRRQLQDNKIKNEYSNPQKIDEAIKALRNIRNQPESIFDYLFLVFNILDIFV